MRYLISALLLSILLFTVAEAQTVTFNVNMKPMLEDSSFVPGQDVLRVTGNIYPLGPNQFVQLRDTSPRDSIFSAEVRFTNPQPNEVLEYTFQILRPENQIERERGMRRIPLRSTDMDLPPIYFNAFAW